MIHVNKEKKERQLPFYIASVILTICCIYMFFTGVSTMVGKTEEERLNTVVNSVKRASVQCYAIEGRYPPSVEYLEERYGIVIDRNKYNVFYSGWASNVMPEITIIPIAEEE